LPVLMQFRFESLATGPSVPCSTFSDGIPCGIVARCMEESEPGGREEEGLVEPQHTAIPISDLVRKELILCLPLWSLSQQAIRVMALVCVSARRQELERQSLDVVVVHEGLCSDWAAQLSAAASELLSRQEIITKGDGAGSFLLAVFAALLTGTQWAESGGVDNGRCTPLRAGTRAPLSRTPRACITRSTAWISPGLGVS
jgi:hypothetical protein